MSRSRSFLYRMARVEGDLESARRGPSALARRVVRRKVYAKVNGGLARLLRRSGL